MSAALELIQTVKANGGCMRVDGDSLVIAPDSAALPIIDELRRHKREIIQLLESCPVIPADDPQAWREDFISWSLERCAFRDGRDDSAGIACLLVDFAEWCSDHNAVPCTRATLERLLADSGFPIQNGMAIGLTLKVDLDAVLSSGATQNTHRRLNLRFTE